MTNEEKAKAYDKALEDMRVIYPNLKGDAKLAVEHAFPQLRESEDERIRKYLIEELKAAKSVGELKFTIPQPTREECIAYLEKQKEQKPKHFDLEAGKWYICHRAFCCRADHITVKEGERFQCEKDGIVKGFVIKEPEKYFKECSAPAPMEDEQKEPHYTKRNALFDKCVENCDPEVMKEVSDKVDEMLGKEQKSSIEETIDKKCISKELIRSILKGIHDGYYEEDYADEFYRTTQKIIELAEEWLKREEQKRIEDVVKDITKNKESAIKFLKSTGIMDDNGELAEIYRSEQKPAEWSEEDKTMINHIIEALPKWANGLITILPSQAEEYVKRLKSLRKD